MRIVVAGLGIQGAACLHALAARGAEVIGCDRYALPHTRGSSHGATRILRFAYYEHPQYVPLVRAALDGWRRLEPDGTLFRVTGVLSLGPEGSGLLAGVRASVAEHDLPHELLTPADIGRRFGLTAPAGSVGLFEPTGGVLAADACHARLLEGARALGGTIRAPSPVTSWDEHNDGVTVHGPDGTMAADALVLAMGPWLATTAAGRALGLRIERQAVFWYDLEPPPAFLWEYEPGRLVYAVPGPGARLKAALHHDGVVLDAPGGAEPEPAEERHVGALVRRLLPGLGPARAAEVCHYTNTPDGHFVIDRLPGAERVFVVSACSGHGFKFAPAIGELVADLVLAGVPAGPFRADRPALRA